MLNGGRLDARLSHSDASDHPARYAGRWHLQIGKRYIPEEA